MGQSTITEWCHDRIKQMLSFPADGPGCMIDATAGTGRDTLFLASLLKEGDIWALDIQEKALVMTKERLEKAGYKAGEEEGTPEACTADGPVHTWSAGPIRFHLVRDGHQHLDRYGSPDTVDLILFNLGYLPGGDHQVATRAETTIEAIEKGLLLLKEDGLLSLMVYSGGDTGFTERDRVLDFVQTLDPRRYTVLVEAFYNRPHHPPLPVFIRKLPQNRETNTDRRCRR